MNQEPRRYTRADYRRAVRRRRIKARVGIVSTAAAVLLLVIGAGVLIVNRLLPGITVNTAGKPESAQTSAVQEPGGKSSGEGGGSPKTGGTDFTQWNQECPWNLIVVNVDNPVPTGYDVITEKYDGTMEVDSRIMELLCDMIRAARADGGSLWISSGYRSNQLQRRLYEDETASYLEKGYPRDNAESMAANAVAVPGTSEHETGLSVDLNEVSDDFKYTEAYRWLSENAEDYGFVQRYPEDKQEITGIITEPWHYRYVGQAAAKAMNAKGLCLEEYAAGLMDGSLEKPRYE